MLGCAAMIKLVYCITRRHGMTPEEFSRYWREVHGPIGRRIPGLRRLVQSHPAPHPADMSPPFDGMAELWFDDLAGLEAARRDPDRPLPHRRARNSPPKVGPSGRRRAHGAARE